MQTDIHQPKLAIGFIAAWFGATVTTLLFAVLFTFYLSNSKVVQPISQSFRIYAALPENNPQISDEVTAGDGRAKIIENFFKQYNSQLSKYSRNFVSVADKYDLDYRLLPAISMQESNGGRRIITDSFNPFGYGIYGNLKIKFSSWEEAIDRVGKALREDYLNQGLNSPQKIMAKYTPPSLEKGGAWAKGVFTFMEELR